MSESNIPLIALFTFIASIPALTWLTLLFRKSEKSKKVIALVFILGCLTAPALLGLQVLWEKYPMFNLSAFIENTFKSEQNTMIALFMLFGALEEVIKHFVVKIVDSKTMYIQTVNDTIKYSIAAALGFSFTENIYYLYVYWPASSIAHISELFIFRSIFTTLAHMLFSGIFGYFYAMGKFSIKIAEQNKIIENHPISVRIISKVFSLPISQAYQQKFVFKGLFIAIITHVTFNYLISVGYKWPVLIFITLAGLYMYYLMKRKAGNLIIYEDITNQKRSSIAKKDEDVIVELIGMWFNDKRYVDVIHICERLLERDPDNKIVALFKAKAMDQMDENNRYKKILSTVIKTKDELSEYDKNILSKHIYEKEMQKKVKDMIKKRIEKEGKKYIDMEKNNDLNKIQEQNVLNLQQAKSAKEVIKKYTGEGIFKLK